MNVRLFIEIFRRSQLRSGTLPVVHHKPLTMHEPNSCSGDCVRRKGGRQIPRKVESVFCCFLRINHHAAGLVIRQRSWMIKIARVHPNPGD